MQVKLVKFMIAGASRETPPKSYKKELESAKDRQER